MSSHSYRAFGLVIRSSVELPELPTRSDHAGVDVTITLEDVRFQRPPEVDNPITRVEVNTNHVVFEVASVARFSVRNGRSIAIQPLVHDQIAEALPFLYGTVWAVLLQQRGLLVLHGCSVETPNGAVCFLGNSGTGKSTLGAQLRTRGFRVLADNVSAIDCSGQVPCVLPGFPSQALWLDTLESLGCAWEKLDPVRDGLSKYVYPLGEAHCPTARPLVRICELAFNPEAVPRVVRLGALEGIAAVLGNTYRQRILRLQDGLAHLQHEHVVSLASSVDMFRAERPKLSCDVEAPIRSHPWILA